MIIVPSIINENHFNFIFGFYFYAIYKLSPIFNVTDSDSSTLTSSVTSSTGRIVEFVVKLVVAFSTVKRGLIL